MLLTFPSRYLFTIGHLECLALWRGRHRFMQNFTGSALLGYHQKQAGWFRLRDYYPLRSSFQRVRLPPGMVTARQVLRPDNDGPTTPSAHRRKAVPCRGFRLIPFRSPLLRESHSLSSPPPTEMFQFSGLPLPALYIQAGVTRFQRAGLPHSGISG